MRWNCIASWKNWGSLNPNMVAAVGPLKQKGYLVEVPEMPGQKHVILTKPLKKHLMK